MITSGIRRWSDGDVSAESGRLRTGSGRPGIVGRRPPSAVFGPGPVAETLPDPLAPLEVELWAEPLRQGLVEALRLAGAASSRRLTRSPAMVVIGGRVAVDLDLSGGRPGRRSLLSRLDPRGPLRRLGVAWRVGRLRAALPQLAGELVARADDDLEKVGLLSDLGDEELLALLRGGPPALAALHGLEMLAGLVCPEDGPAASSLALSALAHGRAAEWSDAEIRLRAPVVLALSAPAVGEPAPLPDVAALPGRPDQGPAEGGVDRLTPRESLRLRIRWIHELSARAAWELGRRLTVAGLLTEPDQVALLTVDELGDGLTRRRLPARFAARRRPATPPLPAAFRLDAAGDPVPVDRPATGPRTRGQGVSPGQGRGPVHQGDEPPPEGAVLVVRSLDPRLAVWLPGLAGVVSETGTALSHVAIVARELGVPVVVGVTAACDRFGAGTVLGVDGTTGEVRTVGTGGNG